jgi:hypothetical protein
MTSLLRNWKRTVAGTELRLPVPKVHFPRVLPSHFIFYFLTNNQKTVPASTGSTGKRRLLVLKEDQKWEKMCRV